MNSPSPLHSEITALEQEWMAAWRARDRGTLERMLAPAFILIISAQPDERFDRNAWLNQALGPYVCRSLEFRGVTVREFDGLAIFSAIARQEASVGGVDRSGEFFVVDVWQRHGSGWQVAARYSSHPEPPGASSGAVRLTAG